VIQSALRSYLRKRDHAIILYVPTFSNTSDLTDHIYRLGWYLYPLLAHINAIVIPVMGIVPVLEEIPIAFDDNIQTYVHQVMSKLVFVSLPDQKLQWLYFAWRADYVMHWQLSAQQQSLEIRLKHKWRVDHHRERYASSFYLKASSEFDERLTCAAVVESAEKFAELCVHHQCETTHIFGTGPNLEQVMARDFSDVTAIACNSMVKNRALMEKLHPSIIVTADPVFHAGVSRYAGRFRQYLRDALEAFDSYWLVPMRDYFVFRANMDAQYTKRLIGVPFVSDQGPNLNMATAFNVTSTANILTLFLIPLATTLSHTVMMAGFDGRPLEENDYFWTHDAASQLTDEMQTARELNPAFFEIDYNDYYLAHCETVAMWLQSAEGIGKQFINTTPSYIPAVQSRIL
jgi:hypothetical protein